MTNQNTNRFELAGPYFIKQDQGLNQNVETCITYIAATCLKFCDEQLG